MDGAAARWYGPGVTHDHEQSGMPANRDGDLALRAAVHDANQLLWVIQGQASLLDRDGADPAVVAAARRIVAAARDAATLLRPLLGAEAGAGRSSPVGVADDVACDLLEVLHDCWQRCLAAAAASGRSETGLHLDAPTPPGPRAGAPALVAARIVTNLLANAIDALDAGGVVTVRVRGGAAGDDVVLELHDDGPGLPAAVAAAPFDEARGSTKPGGHGIGLAGCRALARAHGGDLEVISRPGAGAAFRLRLPAPASLRLLVVDDEASVREMLADVCAVEGHEVRLADGSEAARDLLGREPLDVAVVDLRLPGRSGLDLARDIREADPAIGIVLMTGWGGFAEAADQRVVDFVIEKPLDIPALQSTLRAAGALGARRRREDH